MSQLEFCEAVAPALFPPCAQAGTDCQRCWLQAILGSAQPTQLTESPALFFTAPSVSEIAHPPYCRHVDPFVCCCLRWHASSSSEISIFPYRVVLRRELFNAHPGMDCVVSHACCAFSRRIKPPPALGQVLSRPSGAALGIPPFFHTLGQGLILSVV
jgi:hypothetical protein